MAYLCIKNQNIECDCCCECVGGSDEAPECIVCGSRDCDYFYFKDDEPIGCDECIRREEVW